LPELDVFTAFAELELLLTVATLELLGLLAVLELDVLAVAELLLAAALLDTPPLELSEPTELLLTVAPLELLELMELFVPLLLEGFPARAEDEEMSIIGSEASEEDESSKMLPFPLLLPLLQAKTSKLAKNMHQHLYFINAS
jgi:hypothetical protein